MNSNLQLKRHLITRSRGLVVRLITERSWVQNLTEATIFCVIGIHLDQRTVKNTVGNSNLALLYSVGNPANRQGDIDVSRINF